MSFLTVYSRLYAQCAARALAGIRKNLWTLALPGAFFVVSMLVSEVIARVFGLGGAGGGVLGGLVGALVRAALLSGYFYFVGEIVTESRVSLTDLKRSLGVYLWSFINLGFVLWLGMWVLGRVLPPGTQWVLLFASLAAFVLLNAAPEVIYQRGTYGGIATVQASARFIQESWIEWFLPNIAVAAALWVVWGLVAPLPLPALLVVLVVLSAFLQWFALFRGHLFRELSGSSHRQRMFRYQNPS